MKFKMINGNNIQCVVTEEEMKQYGLGINDIFSNTQKAQYFLNEILDMVEEETGYFIGDGAKTVQAVCLPGNAVALTFSDKEDAEQEVAEESGRKLEVLRFASIMEAIVFAKRLDVYKYERAMLCREKADYYLVVDLSNSDVEEIDYFLAAAFEYAGEVEEDEWRAAYLGEHAVMLIPQHAMHVLAGL